MIDQIVFYKDDHTYWYGDDKLNSVGGWISQFFPKFESEFWLTHGVLKEIWGDEYKKHYSSFKTFMPPAVPLFEPFIKKTSAHRFVNEKLKLSNSWHRKRAHAAFKGTQFHDFMERQAYIQGFLENPWTNKEFKVIPHIKEFDNQSISLDLSTLEDGAYLELLVFDLELGVAGQADMVFIETIDGIRYADFNDFKTNEKKPSRSAPTRCLGVFEKEYASTHFKYTLQLNSYAYLLSRHGFVPRNLAYQHHIDYDPNKKTLIDVNLMLNFHELVVQNAHK